MATGRAEEVKAPLGCGPGILVSSRCVLPCVSVSRPLLPTVSLAPLLAPLSFSSVVVVAAPAAPFVFEQRARSS